LIFEASTATQELGDEMCHDAGLADAAVVIAAYRRSLELEQRALRLDPSRVHAVKFFYAYVHHNNLELGGPTPGAAR